jgi:hypothetical protein
MDDEGTHPGGSARFGRPYLRIAAVAALAVGIAGLGLLGPHPAEPLPQASPPPAASASPSHEAAALVPPAPVATGIDSLGLKPVEPAPGQIAQSWLPTQITSRTLAVVGLRLFYVVGSDRLESSVVGSSDGAQLLASVPRCEAINQLAAAGHTLAYVVTSPGGSAAAIDGCGGSRAVSWSISILDLDGGSARQVAHGTLLPTSFEAAEFPIHLALTDSTYAFDRPTDSTNTELGSTVEVHAIDGSLLWSSPSQAPVTGLMLGGDRLAVLTDRSTQSGPLKSLWISDASHPELSEVARPASSASLAPDGSYLAWDVWRGATFAESPAFPEVAIEMLQSGRVEALTTLSGSTVPDELHPSVAVTRAGPAIAWFATGPDGSVYPAFRLAGGGDGAILASFQQPVWMSVEGSTLIWVAETPDGWSNAAFAVDLPSLAPK